MAYEITTLKPGDIVRRKENNWFGMILPNGDWIGSASSKPRTMSMVAPPRNRNTSDFEVVCNITEIFNAIEKSKS
jgi:hypothetical protein